MATIAACDVVITTTCWQYNHLAALPCSTSQALPKALGARTRKHIEGLFEWMMPACLRFVRKEVKEISPTEDIGLARR